MGNVVSWLLTLVVWLFVLRFSTPLEFFCSRSDVPSTDVSFVVVSR